MGEKAVSQLPNVLIVDDTPENLRVISEMLTRRGYKARPVLDGTRAIQAAENDPPDLILLDILMPPPDGYEVCRQLKAHPKLKDIPVIFLSALNETLDKVKAFRSGGVDYITKPFQAEEVFARLETQLQLREVQTELVKHNAALQGLVREKIREIYDSQMATIFALARLAESRDDDTGKHLERVRTLAMLLATHLSEGSGVFQAIDPAFIENIYYASPLHDIGKVGIRDAILLKPGKLTPPEFEEMKRHTILGATTLEAVRNKYSKNSFITMGIEVAQSHHEKWDGSGYPQGLNGLQIPLSARIVAVADVYDALRSDRCYRNALPHQECCEIIDAASGTHFDSRIVTAFQALHSQLEHLGSD